MIENNNNIVVIENEAFQIVIARFMNTKNNIVVIENEAFQIVIARFINTNNNIVVIENEAFQIVIARSPDCFTLLSATHFADPKGFQFYIHTHKVLKVLLKYYPHGS